MSEGPIRATVRGGRDQFQWSSIKEDKHYHNYLGHSLRASRGRWQEGKDLEWFSRAVDSTSAPQSAEDARKEELRRVKEAEEDATLVALGLPPKDRSANSIPLGRSRDPVTHPETPIKQHDKGDERRRRHGRERSRSRDRRRRERTTSSTSPHERYSTSQRHRHYHRRHHHHRNRSSSRSRSRSPIENDKARLRNPHESHAYRRHESGREARRKERDSRRSRSRSPGGRSRSRY